VASLRSVILTMFCLSVCAHAQTRSLTIHPNHLEGLDSLTRHSLDIELKRLMLPAGIVVSVENEKQRGEMPPIAEHLIVGSFAGSCSVEAMPELADSRGSVLGEAAVSDGKVLPYFTINCPRVLRLLSPVIRPLNRSFRGNLLGRALARVIAHELFHILAQTGEHDHTGIAQSKLTFQDLLSDKFDLSPTSLERIQGVKTVAN
jgi:hypothetical protein